VQTVQKAADLAVQTGSRLYTDAASSYRALKGYLHAYVNHTQKEYARGDVHENRAECLLSLLKPYLQGFRGVSKCNLPGYLGFWSGKEMTSLSPPPLRTARTRHRVRGSSNLRTPRGALLL
jgi:hypothetical protein